jgi:hypothetical protein
LLVNRDPRLLALTLWGMAHGYASLAVSFPSIPLISLQEALVIAGSGTLAGMLTEEGSLAWSAGVGSESVVGVGRT